MTVLSGRLAAAQINGSFWNRSSRSPKSDFLGTLQSFEQRARSIGQVSGSLDRILKFRDLTLLERTLRCAKPERVIGRILLRHPGAGVELPDKFSLVFVHDDTKA